MQMPRNPDLVLPDPDFALRDNTALLAACARGHEEVARLLLLSYS